jgi:hypothetical protein
LILLPPLVGSQSQTDAIYFNLTSGFDLVPHTLTLHKLSVLGFSGGYASWFRGYLTNRLSQIRISGVTGAVPVSWDDIPSPRCAEELQMTVILGTEI